MLEQALLRLAARAGYGMTVRLCAGTASQQINRHKGGLRRE
jgi:hypothetical protein